MNCWIVLLDFVFFLEFRSAILFVQRTEGKEMWYLIDIHKHLCNFYMAVKTINSCMIQYVLIPQSRNFMYYKSYYSCLIITFLEGKDFRWSRYHTYHIQNILHSTGVGFMKPSCHQIPYKVDGKTSAYILEVAYKELWQRACIFNMFWIILSFLVGVLRV